MKDLIGKIVDKNYRMDAFIESGGMVVGVTSLDRTPAVVHINRVEIFHS